MTIPKMRPAKMYLVGWSDLRAAVGEPICRLLEEKTDQHLDGGSWKSAATSSFVSRVSTSFTEAEPMLLERTEVRKQAEEGVKRWKLREETALVDAMRVAGTCNADAVRAHLRVAIAARLYVDALTLLLASMQHMTTDKEVASAFQSIPTIPLQNLAQVWDPSEMESAEVKACVDEKLALLGTLLGSPPKVCPSCLEKAEEKWKEPAVLSGRGSYRSVNAAVEAAIEEQRPACATMNQMKAALMRRWKEEDRAAHPLSFGVHTAEQALDMENGQMLFVLPRGACEELMKELAPFGPLGTWEIVDVDGSGDAVEVTLIADQIGKKKSIDYEHVYTIDLKLEEGAYEKFEKAVLELKHAADAALIASDSIQSYGLPPIQFAPEKVRSQGLEAPLTGSLTFGTKEITKRPQIIPLGRAVRRPENARPQRVGEPREAFVGSSAMNWNAHLVAKDAGLIVEGEYLHFCVACGCVTNAPHQHRCHGSREEYARWLDSWHEPGREERFDP
jgi:hypothetical protein